jgi:hypothetical protein
MALFLGQNLCIEITPKLVQYNWLPVITKNVPMQFVKTKFDYMSIIILVIFTTQISFGSTFSQEEFGG